MYNFNGKQVVKAGLELSTLQLQSPQYSFYFFKINLHIKIFQAPALLKFLPCILIKCHETDV